MGVWPMFPAHMILHTHPSLHGPLWEGEGEEEEAGGGKEQSVLLPAGRPHENENMAPALVHTARASPELGKCSTGPASTFSVRSAQSLVQGAA